MTRWWLGSIGGTTRPPTPHRFRPSLEGMDDRIVPDATLLVPPMLGTQVQAAVSTDAAANTTVTIDFTSMGSAAYGGLIREDYLTITISDCNGDIHTLTTHIGDGTTPAALAQNIAAALRNAGYADATASGNSVTFNGTDICDVTAEHTNTMDNGSPVVTITRLE